MHVTLVRRAQRSVAGLALFAISAAVPAAAGPAPSWTQQLGTAGLDNFSAVTVDPSGNIVAAGQVNSFYAWLVKFDTSGRELWRSQLTTTVAPSTPATGVASDSSGNILVSMYTNYPQHDAYVAKYRPTGGTALWTKRFGTSGYDSSWAVAADTAGNAYVVGSTTGKLGASKFGAVNDYDVWVAKLSAAGIVLWTRQIGTSKNDYGYGLAVDRSSNIFVVGTTWGPLGGPDPGAARYVAFVTKLDGTGTRLWTKQVRRLTNPPGGVSGYAVAVDRSGNVVIAGRVVGGNVVAGTYDGYDAWVAKYTSGGSRSWIRQFGVNRVANGDDGSSDVAIDSAGNVVLTGYRPSSISYDYDAFVRKYGPTGAYLWESVLNSGRTDVGSAIATDAIGNTFVAGVTQGSLAATSLGMDDAFIAKFPLQ